MRQLKAETSVANGSTPLLALGSASKTFSGQTVLKSVDLEVAPGEIHGLVGENGAGKSTLVKILAGYHVPDSGTTLKVRGQPVDFPITSEGVSDLGLSFVHQDLGLADEMTVMDNVRVRRYRTKRGWRIPWASEREEVFEVLSKIKAVPPEALVESLGPVDRTVVAIARALQDVSSWSAGLLVLDEPTAQLPPDGAQHLFDALKEIVKAGHSVLLVTHSIGDVIGHTDRVTVLRDGSVVDTLDTPRTSETELVEKILGRKLGELYPESYPPLSSETALTAHDVAGESISGCSFRLSRGEILGFTGLIGSGYEEIPSLLFGMSRRAKGDITVGAKQFDLEHFGPEIAINAGLGLVPGKRIPQGAVLEASVLENLTLITLSRFFNRGFLDGAKEVKTVRSTLRHFDVNPREPHRELGTLSGGNQQKVVLAKWLERNPEVLILHEPASGVDMGARQQIFRYITQVAERGTSIILVSAEYEDLAHLCDRVMIFSRGQITAEVGPPNLTANRIVECCIAGSHAGKNADAEEPR